MNYLQFLFWDQFKLLNEIMRTRHANLMTSVDISMTWNIFKGWKTAADSIFDPHLTYFQANLALDPKTKFAIHNLIFNFC